MRAARRLRRNLDVVVFGLTLLSVGPLMGWWAVLVRRNILATDRAMRQQYELVFQGAEKLQRMAELDSATDRQLFMIAGESTMAGVLLFILTVVLFVVAKTRQRENHRMQTMLQLTAHQLKTPLAGVRALMQSIGAGSIPLELQQPLLTQGIAECDRLEHMVETMLAYQRAVAGQASRREVVQTQQLVDEILEHRRRSFPDEVVTWASKEGLQVACDRDAVRVVMENLLDNAKKYGGGQVTMVEGAENSRWRLEVRDEGQGFEPHESERLFEPFERGGGSGVQHGSGLGLYISRQLARQMRGDLTAASRGPGQGSTFSLELPLVPK